MIVFGRMFHDKNKKRRQKEGQPVPYSAVRQALYSEHGNSVFSGLMICFLLKRPEIRFWSRQV